MDDQNQNDELYPIAVLIDELRNDEEPGFAKHARDFRREEAVLAAEKQSKISIFYDVTAGIQGNDEQQ